jgi:pyridoxine kinase
MNILSIQSHVAYGHVGNSAAVFALQRLGIEVWPVHTVQFSNHPGYGAFKGQVFAAAAIRDVIDGIEARGALAQCDGVLSGYMGSAETGAAILDAVARVKRANAGALYCCDPVIGDTGRGVYVQAGLPEFIAAQALPVADIVAPNYFELQHLTGMQARNLSGLRDALDAVHKRGPGVILVTSVESDDTPGDCIDLVASEGGEAFRVRTPKLPVAVNGAGDAIAALFFAHYLRERSAAIAMSRAVSSVFGILERTAERGSREILLIEAQEELARPGRLFEAEKIG